MGEGEGDASSTEKPPIPTYAKWLLLEIIPVHLNSVSAELEDKTFSAVIILREGFIISISLVIIEALLCAFENLGTFFIRAIERKHLFILL